MMLARCSTQFIIGKGRSRTLQSLERVAYKSTAASAAGECPFTGSPAKQEAAVESGKVEFKKIPALPLIGSLWSAWSGTPPMKTDANPYITWPALRKDFGDFYSIGIPGLGNGLTGETIILQSPEEYMKVVRKEAKFPHSIVERQWALVDLFATESKFGRVNNLFKSGEEWKLMRTFLQTDIFSPQSAARYVPNIIRAAEHASKGAAHHSHAVLPWLSMCTFDLFNVILFGELSRIADPTIKSAQDDEEFALTTANFLSKHSKLTQNVMSFVAHKFLGYETSFFKEVRLLWRRSNEIGKAKIERFHQRRLKGDLNAEEEESYLNHALTRQEGQDEISVQEAKDIGMGMLTASVDTTAGMISWHLMHTALNPHVQQTIREELQPHLTEDGRLTLEAISAKNAPYLHAVIRESNRLTPPIPIIGFRTVDQEVELYGHKVDKGSFIGFDSYSQGMDPEFMDDPEEFRPERWLPDAVAARKGTKSEILDHPLFSGPFSQGARRCPGSRVSRNEALIFMAQLILDWNISIAGVNHWQEIEPVLETLNVPKLPQMSFEPAR